MTEKRTIPTTDKFSRFTRDSFGGEERITAIGGGFVGGKASGLGDARDLLRTAFPDSRFEDFEVTIPSLVVLGTDIFDQFMSRNHLHEIARSGEPDRNIANAFQRADLPTEIVGDLRGLIDRVKLPLAVRSSSMLEDATYQPFAGVYATKMIPNNQPDADSRYRRLLEAIRFVYASTYFKEARGYREAAGAVSEDEKMAVVIQEVLGLRHGDRFYPTISGVARSYNFYPAKPARPEDGVVELALGLGKTIVDGEGGWSYSPAHPKQGPPCTTSELLQQTQNRFWAVGMGKPPAFDPVNEVEFLVHSSLQDADYDGVLGLVASTYDPRSDRIVAGTGRVGPRVLDFAPVLQLQELALNDLVRNLITGCEEQLGTEIEMEFAVATDPLKRSAPRFGLLQVRPIVVSHDAVEISDSEMTAENLLLLSRRALGHGTKLDLVDIVYVKPDVFDKAQTRRIAQEIGQINRTLHAAGRGYILITFGRLGSSDPWLGVPVDWGEISAARVLVEATLEDMNVELSQGSHFFHNMTNRGLLYLTASFHDRTSVHWERLEGLTVESETELVRHVRLESPCTVKVDGRQGRGVILL